MKRWTIRILLCLTLGVVTTVGVAWGLALRGAMLGPVRTPLDQIALSPTLRQRWRQEVPPEFHSRQPQLAVLEIDRVGHRLVALHEDPRLWSLQIDEYGQTTPDQIVLEMAFITEQGWPCKAQSASIYLQQRGDFETTNYWAIDQSYGNFEWLIDVWPFDFTSPPLVALRPILPGFIVNTLFYAAVWIVLFFGFGFVKRTIRRRRGRCLRCGYDLRGGVTNGQDARSTGCPECGWNRGGVRP